jgi:hypothetical protein
MFTKEKPLPLNPKNSGSGERVPPKLFRGFRGLSLGFFGLDFTVNSLGVHRLIFNVNNTPSVAEDGNQIRGLVVGQVGLESVAFRDVRIAIFPAINFELVCIAKISRGFEFHNFALGFGC